MNKVTICDLVKIVGDIYGGFAENNISVGDKAVITRVFQGRDSTGEFQPVYEAITENGVDTELYAEEIALVQDGDTTKAPTFQSQDFFNVNNPTLNGVERAKLLKIGAEISE
jgi:hypothetical protein